MLIKVNLSNLLLWGSQFLRLFLAELPHRSSHYVVIDGKQRLLSLLQFIAPEKKIPEGFSKFKLSGLKYRKDLNGKSFEDIQASDDGITIENAVIRTVVVRSVKEDSYLYEIFLRLNTQSMKLSPQELRQALVPGPFTDFIDDTATSSQLIKRTLNIKEPDRRMRDNELVLRYFAFATRLSDYAGNFRKFLDDTTSYYNKNWDGKAEYLKMQSLELESAIKATFDIFGRHSFQVYEDQEYTRRFNRAVFDIMVFFFSHRKIRSAAIDRARDIEGHSSENAWKIMSFRNSFSSNTKEVSNVFTRLSTWSDVLRCHLDTRIPKLVLDDRRILVAY
ncbi:DUF262 domain-containing protein [Azospirillum sp. INR13]|uniref:GmrSD restriction endonuclease domain-containing protein n=1 Tax=Azospirillum sp. INR13 TaxID=2596919 RepID=UPI00210726D6|nr:DUF262 domain-containing protein [Azospirillum sp. INR13]MBF5095483.1 DUF262 domain-containing protein [Azospirillum sp. INR13]